MTMIDETTESTTSRDPLTPASEPAKKRSKRGAPKKAAKKKPAAKPAAKKAPAKKSPPKKAKAKKAKAKKHQPSTTARKGIHVMSVHCPVALLKKLDAKVRALKANGERASRSSLAVKGLLKMC